ncbi:hypothetical protein RJT34_30987 [Clitoria ternatea]|uniref:Uncharacterized protein n=1 Tax=Clitoria ternatea TaxID=43366 RepID=A0AAN9EUH8_CLITE
MLMPQVVALRLRLAEKETAGICLVSLVLFLPAEPVSFVGEVAGIGWDILGSDISHLPKHVEAKEFLLLIIFLRDDAAISTTLLLLEVELFDGEAGVVHRLLPCLDIGLDFGVSILDLPLIALDRSLGLQISSSTLLFSLSPRLVDVIASCMH